MTSKSVSYFLLVVLSVALGLSFLASSRRCMADADLTSATPPTGAIWLDSIDLSKITQDWGKPGICKAVDGVPITLAGVVYSHGVGINATSSMVLDLHGDATRFQAVVGVDDAVKPKGSVTFQVIVDGKVKLSTAVLRGGDAPQPVDIDLTGAKTLILLVGDGGDGIDYDHADWAGAAVTLTAGGAAPTCITVPTTPPRLVILPPNPLPEIHYPHVVGSTPGRPFLFLVPATGRAPLYYTAAGLPTGLTIGKTTGIISGSLTGPGTTVTTIMVQNAFGKATSKLTIVGGTHVLAQTPPMGWNSWNVWAEHVDEQKVKDAADVMISSGLAAHGYQYVNTDDTWEAGRDAAGNILCNGKFPDMKGMADYIHAKGLKAGIYSSPGPSTCGGYTASYQHEDQDAQSYAAWGFDYLKYDWCSYGNVAGPSSAADYYTKPYSVMRASLDETNRDIVFSFCQYGMGDVWKWGQSIGGNCWRTTWDDRDNWDSIHNIYESQAGHEAYAGPGHWNDPDMLCVGIVGWGNTHPSGLTPNEQILHISMWSMLSAPLLIGCDMTKLDPFTLAVLTNDEIIAIDQDSLGKPASKIAALDSGGEIWARPLAGGAEAVALLNTAVIDTPVTVTWAQLGLSGNQAVRDLWLHKNIGDYAIACTVDVPAHGAVVLKVSPTKSTAVEH